MEIYSPRITVCKRCDSILGINDGKLCNVCSDKKRQIVITCLTIIITTVAIVLYYL